MLTFESQRCLCLPTVPDGFDGAYIVSHPGTRRMPFQAKTTTDVAANLGAEPELEPAIGYFLQGPG